MIKVQDLKPNDMIDLESDRFADPARSNVALECEFCVVETVKRECTNTVVVYTDKINVAFPPDHEVKVARMAYEECGCCGHLHRPGYTGDCRNDEARFTFDQLDAVHGPDGWTEVTLEEQTL